MPILIIGLVALAVFSGIGILLFTATAAEHHDREEHPDTAQGHHAG